VNRKNLLALALMLVVSLTAFAQTLVKRSESVIRNNAIKIEDPDYPRLAKLAKQEGKVEVEIVIDETGDVINAASISGPPLLQAAAVQAAKDSKFRPTLLSGEPVKVGGVLTFEFVLPRDQDEKAEKSDKPKSSDYKQLLDRVKNGDQTVDYTALRMAFTETDDYSPYAPSSSSLRPIYAAFNDHKFQLAIELADKVLEKDYVCPDAHQVASLSYGALGNEKKAEYHRLIAQKLLDSIRKSGNGKSMDTAMVVITTGEEYFVMREMGLKVTSQGLLHQDKHSFDVLTGVSPTAKEPLEVYFQIDKIFGHMEQLFKKPAPVISGR